MGTEVEYESYSKVLYSMNEDSSSSSWPHFYGEKAAPFLQFNNGYNQRNVENGYVDLEKDALKHKMLEHEAIFKNQVYELHRLYRIQRSMMDEVRRKEVRIFQPSVEPALSQMEAVQWKPANFPLLNFVNGRTSGFPASFSREDSAVLNVRYSKVKRTFDNYIDIKEEGEPENGTKKFLVDASGFGSGFRGSVELVDLNEPILTEGTVVPSVKLDLTSDIKCLSQASNRFFNSSELYNRGQLSHTHETENLLHDLNLKGVSRSMVDPPAQSNQLHKFPFTSDIHHGAPNQVHSCPVEHPSSSLAGYSTTVDSHMPNSFQFLSSSPCPQASSIPSFVPGVRMEPLSQNQEWFIRKGLMKSGSWMTPDLRAVELGASNRLHHGSGLTSNGSWLDLKPGRFDSHNGSTFNHDTSNILKVPCQQDGDSANMAIDLNREIPGRLSDEVVILEDLNASFPKVESKNCTSTLPWLKTKPNNVTEAASLSRLSCRDEADEYAETTKSVNKIMGFSVLFEREARENKPSSLISTTSCRGKSRMIDINMACDLEEDETAVDAIVDRKEQTKGASTRCYIDLNTSVSDFEDQQAPSDEQGVEALRNAAELVLAMSMTTLHPKTPMADDSYCRLSSECLLDESLFAFADAITAAEIEATTSKKIMDEFEASVLQLEETKEQDYLPRPVAFELENAEETGANASTSRSRRVQTRRGRQRGDFQRDILPGMASLSRHEVSEDVQIFSGLMKATGHRWKPGMARRNDGRNILSRGRKQAVVEPIPSPPSPPISTLLIQKLGYKDKSLTGWGKTTRRPRRQR